MEQPNGIKMIEFFSGIGGMRYALDDAIKFHNSSLSGHDIIVYGDSDSDSDGVDEDEDEYKDGAIKLNDNNTTKQQTVITTDKSQSPSSLLSCITYEISLYANQTYSLNFNEPISSFKNDRRSSHPGTGSSTRKHKRKHEHEHEHSKSESKPESKSACVDNTNKTKDTQNKKPFAIYTKLIEQLQPQDVNEVDLWTMSPPCQPFTNTRHAKQRDSDDERCKGFKAIINLLKTIEDVTKRPKWILVENVKGFFGSDMLDQWYDCLKECEYTWEEYLLSPTQFGVPNNRTRYYMVAERSDRFFSSTSVSCKADLCCRTELQNNVNDANDSNGEVVVPSGTKMNTTSTTMIRPLSDYIQHLNEKDRQPYIIPDHVFEAKWAKDLPVVCSLDRITHCFTAGYGRQIHRATGSLLLMDRDGDDGDGDDDDNNTNHRDQSIADQPIDRSDMTLYKGKIRRFTEKELLALFGFPSNFCFPESLSLDHRYKLIGNSVNVKVISALLQYLLFGG